MSLLNKMKEMRRPAERTPAVNLVIEVLGYDVANTPHVVIGKRMDTGAEVRVFLREDTVFNEAEQKYVTAERKYKRPEIADFANAKHKVGTPAGGIMRLDKCWADFKTPGLFSAQWAKSLSKGPEEEVMLALTRVGAKPKENSNEKSYWIEVLRPDASRVVTSMEELKEAMLAGFENNGVTSPFVILRATQEGSEPVSVVFTASRSQNGTYKRTDSAEVCYQNSLDHGIFQGPDLEEGLADPATTIEIIPGERIFAGKDTAAAFNEKGSKIEVPYQITPDKPYTGYAFSSVVLRRHEDGAPYFTDVAPMETKPRVYPMDLVPTPAFGGLNPAPQPDAGRESPAPDAGESDAVEQALASATKTAADKPAPTPAPAKPAAAAPAAPAAQTAAAPAGNDPADVDRAAEQVAAASRRRGPR